VMLYTTNRGGYHDDDSYLDMKESKPEVFELAQKIRMTFNQLYQTLHKNFSGHSVAPIIVSSFAVPRKEKTDFKEEKDDQGGEEEKKSEQEYTMTSGNKNSNLVNVAQKDKKPMEHKSSRKDEKVIWRYIDMRVRQRLETDYDILLAFTVEIVQLNKNRSSIPEEHQPYIKQAFYEFFEACNEYKEVQSRKTPHRFGEIAIPTLGYRVLTKKDLDEKDKIS